MTREEKLQKAHQMFDDRELLIELKWQREYFKRGYVSSQEELFNLWIFDECIKALQEPCEDAISRQAVLDKKELVELEDGQSFYCISPEQVETLQPVTPQPKKGHWIYDKSIDNWICSKCGETPKTIGYVGSDAFMAEHFKYCNHCGAKMEESEDKENE